MVTRRHFLLAATAATATTLPVPAFATSTKKVRIPRKYMPQKVSVGDATPAGEIHVFPEKHFLFWTLGKGKAMRYGIAVGAAGRNFKGTAYVGRKAEWPSWTPTANMIRLEPQIYAKYSGGLPGGHERNPLGARALYLYQGGRDTYYRIHGTPQPWTIGRSFSSGCIRLTNTHVSQLYPDVPTGTKVVVY
ncbi:L,D-transpeptidase-like protein [Aliiruegeria haliotis]|uniref:L,D-transpeptidase-like protein n=1 Tax=Aliiruegeria haliotis TaxID=1280846 RepID=A0A2T0RIB1_9RHOB|nr:L,D-transpeptidase [Aliiruegeria haliotis]PRY20915.1 L,D-transpeptidase-like protein [Aliiruegeria haliotis]